MGLRLLLLGPPAAWLPGWRDGRLVVGSSARADFRLDGPAAPDVVVELGEGGVLVRPARGEPRRVPRGASFQVGRHVIAVADDAPALAPDEGPACFICEAVDPAARRLGDVAVCPTCTRRLDLPAGACPGYELLGRLGVGGFGVVYLALHEPSRRLVAIKAVRPTDDPERTGRAAHRLAREIRILAGLDHPGIVRLLDAVAAGPLTFLVSELVPGGDARARLDRDGPLPVLEVLELGARLASALAYAHARGVVHRDVKPENVLLGADGQPRLVDFGLARQLSDVVGTTATGAGMGSLLYAAPEQLAEARSAGPPADVFGLAATLFHLVTGAAPRQTERGAPGPRPLEAVPLGKLLAARPARADEVRRDVPGALADLLAAGLAQAPVDRPTAADLGAKLAGLARFNRR